MTQNVLIIFVKNLIEGHVKTRLAATIGDRAAMDIYQQLLQKVHHTTQLFDADKVIFYSDFIADDLWETTIFRKHLQDGNSLGIRMKNAFKNSFNDGYEKSVLIGTDCPGINEDILKDAFSKLDDYDVVIGPALDGGYYLIGMKNEYPYLFKNIMWSTSLVLEQTIDLCNKHHLSYFLLPELSDIDEEKDLVYFKDLLILNKKDR